MSRGQSVYGLAYSYNHAHATMGDQELRSAYFILKHVSKEAREAYYY